MSMKFATRAVLVHTDVRSNHRYDVTDDIPQPKYLGRIPNWVKARMRELDRTGQFTWHRDGWGNSGTHRKWPRWEQDLLQKLISHVNKETGDEYNYWHDHQHSVVDANGNEFLTFEPYHLSLEDVPAIQLLAKMLGGAKVWFSSASPHYPLHTILIVFAEPGFKGNDYLHTDYEKSRVTGAGKEQSESSQVLQ